MNIYPGKYEAIETAAPASYMMDPTPLPFVFTYEGQNVELVSQSVEAKNDFQQIKITILIFIHYVPKNKR